MRRATIAEVIALIVAAIFSGGGFAWLISLSTITFGMWSRLGLIAAVLSALWMFLICWAACWGYIARKKSWTWRNAAAWVMLPIWLVAVLVGLVGVFTGTQSLMFAAVLLSSHFMLLGTVFRRLAFPNLSAAEAAAPPPPLTLFPR